MLFDTRPRNGPNGPNGPNGLNSLNGPKKIHNPIS